MSLDFDYVFNNPAIFRFNRLLFHKADTFVNTEIYYNDESQHVNKIVKIIRNAQSLYLSLYLFFF